MSRVISQMSVSLDGFAAGPDQTMEEPLGRGGERLHEWAFPTESWRALHGLDGGVSSVDSEVAAEVQRGIGAYIMGRKMFAGAGPWDPEWRGWWGEEPPYHTPVFVLTHHTREPLELTGTTFHFVTDGIRAALDRAREAAGDLDVSIAGGANVIQQYLRAGLLEELYLHIAPILLGDGERLFADVGDPVLLPVKVVASPAATHIKYRVGG